MPYLGHKLQWWRHGEGSRCWICGFSRSHHMGSGRWSGHWFPSLVRRIRRSDLSGFSRDDRRKIAIRRMVLLRVAMFRSYCAFPRSLLMWDRVIRQYLIFFCSHHCFCLCVTLLIQLMYHLGISGHASPSGQLSFYHPVIVAVKSLSPSDAELSGPFGRGMDFRLGSFLSTYPNLIYILG